MLFLSWASNKQVTWQPFPGSRDGPQQPCDPPLQETTQHRELQQTKPCYAASSQSSVQFVTRNSRAACLNLLFISTGRRRLVSIVANKQTCTGASKLIFIDIYKSLSQAAGADEWSASSRVVWLDDWRVQAARINRELWLWTRNDWLVQHDLKLNHKISNTVDCARRLHVTSAPADLPTVLLN